METDDINRVGLGERLIFTVCNVIYSGDENCPSLKDSVL
jgi:hypothetical protein